MLGVQMDVQEESAQSACRKNESSVGRVGLGPVARKHRRLEEFCTTLARPAQEESRRTLVRVFFVDELFLEVGLGDRLEEEARGHDELGLSVVRVVDESVVLRRSASVRSGRATYPFAA